jgi:hypothetical protein
MIFLAYLLLCCIVGMIFFCRALVHRWRSYNRYRRFKAGERICYAKDAELPPRDLGFSHSALQRLHGAGLLRGLLPNPREWWECVRNWCKYGIAVRGDLLKDETWVIHKFLLNERAKESIAKQWEVIEKAKEKWV